MAKKTNTIPVRVDDQTKQALQREADEQRRTLSDFIRLAAEYVMENKIKL